MNFKKIGLCIALTSFTLTLFAQPVTYSFSSFGGGLPSSIQVAQSPVQNVDYGPGSIIIEEDTDEYISDEETTKKNTKTTKKKDSDSGLIALYIIGGLVLATGIIVGSLYFTNESSECCQASSDALCEGCSEGLGEFCAESLTETCASSADSSECATQITGALFGNGLSLLPIFIP